MKKILLAALVLSASTSAMANVAPNLSQEKGLGIQGLIPENSTFSDVMKIYGLAKFKSEGDASTSYVSVCYFSADGTQVLSFGADEMHGGGGSNDHKKQIFGDITIKFADVRDRGLCAQTNAKFALMNGLAIGQSEDKFSSALKSAADTMAINFESYKFVVSNPNGFYQQLDVGISFDSQERAEKIQLGQTSSN